MRSSGDQSALLDLSQSTGLETKHRNIIETKHRLGSLDSLLVTLGETRSPNEPTNSAPTPKEDDMKRVSATTLPVLLATYASPGSAQVNKLSDVADQLRTGVVGEQVTVTQQGPAMLTR